MSTFATSESAGAAVDFAHAFARLRGDEEAFIHTQSGGSTAIGDPGLSGESAEDHYCERAVLRYCVGSADACWIWDLREFVREPFGSLRRVQDYYDRRLYPRRATEI